MNHEQTAFAAAVYDPRLGEDWVPGQITLDAYRLRFLAQSTSFDIPLVRLQIELDKSPESTQVLFRDPNLPDTCVSTSDIQILEHRALRQQACTRNQIEAIQSVSELKRRLKITGAFLGAFALLALVVSLGLGIMVRSLVDRIPPELEQELGDSALAEFKDEEVFLDDAKLKETVETAAAPLIAVLPKNAVGYQFYVVEDSLPNAFALPGGHVVVTRRLIEIAERPEEIAGVLAHEIAHVTLKHSFREAISSAGPYLIFSVFMRGGGGLLGVLGGGSQLLVHQSFSQEYELEADAAGWDYLVAAKIDPRALTEMLKKIEVEQRRDQPLSDEPGAFSSHPATEKRIRKLEAKWRKLKDKSVFEQPVKSD